MEERIIDDEYGRGVRLKKTKDGYVDVTDELAEEVETENEETEGEEVAFEFPQIEEDETDEDLIGLDPAEVERIRKEREEEAARRRAEYERLCAEGEELLLSGSFKASELKYEKALKMDDEAKEASVGYWRAKTSDFTDPDALVSEYIDEGVESMEYDLGYRAIDEIKQNYNSAFVARLAELTAEEAPLKEKVSEKQAYRRKYLKDRVKRSAIAFGVAALPFIVGLILTIVFGLKNFSTPDDTYVIPSIALGAATLVFFIAFVAVANKFINACRMYRSNEKLSSTEDGARLEQITLYKELYEYLTDVSGVAETSEEIAE